MAKKRSGYKTHFYTLTKRNFLDELAEAGVGIQKDIADQFMLVMVNCLEKALDKTFKQMEPSLNKTKNKKD